jgi:hypothetical protein
MIVLDNNKILWKIDSNKIVGFLPGIVDSFENFGSFAQYSANSIIEGKASSGCSSSYVDENHPSWFRYIRGLS